MDKTRVCGTLAPGSTPGEGTKKRPAWPVFYFYSNLNLFNLFDLSR